jgi:DNA-binding NarL/FixJ family response regulator
MPLSLVIVDDSLPFLRSASALLEQEGLQVLGVASEPAGARALVAQLRPDVVLVDLHLGRVSGLDLARELRSEGPAGPAVIIVSAAPDADVLDLVRDATHGFLSKSELSAAAVVALTDRRRSA